MRRQAQTAIRSVYPEIERLLESIDVERQRQWPGVFGPLPFRVVFPWSAPRDPRWQFLLDVGRNDLECVFGGHEFYPASKRTLTFVFPERWMSVVERSGFVDALRNHPQTFNHYIEQCDIVTHDRLITSQLQRRQVTTVRFDDKEIATCPSNRLAQLLKR